MTRQAALIEVQTFCARKNIARKKRERAREKENGITINDVGLRSSRVNRRSKCSCNRNKRALIEMTMPQRQAQIRRISPQVFPDLLGGV